MRSVVTTSTAALTILTLGRVADQVPPIYDRGLAYSLSDHLPGQVDTSAADGANGLRVNGTRRPSWSVNVRRAGSPRYPNVIGRRGRSLFISDVDARYGFDDAPPSGQRQHRDQRWSERASAVGR